MNIDELLKDDPKFDELINNLFEKYDVDNSQYLEGDEIYFLIDDLCKERSNEVFCKEQIEFLLTKFDINNDNKFEKHELKPMINYLFRELAGQRFFKVQKEISINNAIKASITELYSKYDILNRGYLLDPEMDKFCKDLAGKYNLKITDKHINQLKARIDQNGDGNFELIEFLDIISKVADNINMIQRKFDAVDHTPIKGKAESMEFLYTNKNTNLEEKMSHKHIKKNDIFHTKEHLKRSREEKEKLMLDEERALIGGAVSNILLNLAGLDKSMNKDKSRRQSKINDFNLKQEEGNTPKNINKMKENELDTNLINWQSREYIKRNVPQPKLLNSYDETSKQKIHETKLIIKESGNSIQSQPDSKNEDPNKDQNLNSNKKNTGSFCRYCEHCKRNFNKTNTQVNNELFSQSEESNSKTHSEDNNSYKAKNTFDKFDRKGTKADKSVTSMDYNKFNKTGTSIERDEQGFPQSTLSKNKYKPPPTKYSTMQSLKSPTNAGKKHKMGPGFEKLMKIRSINPVQSRVKVREKNFYLATMSATAPLEKKNLLRDENQERKPLSNAIKSIISENKDGMPQENCNAREDYALAKHLDDNPWLLDTGKRQIFYKAAKTMVFDDLNKITNMAKSYDAYQTKLDSFSQTQQPASFQNQFDLDFTFLDLQCMYQIGNEDFFKPLNNINVEILQKAAALENLKFQKTREVIEKFQHDLDAVLNLRYEKNIVDNDFKQQVTIEDGKLVQGYFEVIGKKLGKKENEVMFRRMTLLINKMTKQKNDLSPKKLDSDDKNNSIDSPEHKRPKSPDTVLKSLFFGIGKSSSNISPFATLFQNKSGDDDQKKLDAINEIINEDNQIDEQNNYDKEMGTSKAKKNNLGKSFINNERTPKSFTNAARKSFMNVEGKSKSPINKLYLANEKQKKNTPKGKISDKTEVWRKDTQISEAGSHSITPVNDKRGSPIKSIRQKSVTNKAKTGSVKSEYDKSGHFFLYNIDANSNINDIRDSITNDGKSSKFRIGNSSKSPEVKTNFQIDKKNMQKKNPGNGKRLLSMNVKDELVRHLDQSLNENNDTDNSRNKIYPKRQFKNNLELLNATIS